MEGCRAWHGHEQAGKTAINERASASCRRFSRLGGRDSTTPSRGEPEGKKKDFIEIHGISRL